MDYRISDKKSKSILYSEDILYFHLIIIIFRLSFKIALGISIYRLQSYLSCSLIIYLGGYWQ